MPPSRPDLFRFTRRRPALQREAVPLLLADGSVRDVLRVRDPRARRMRLTVTEGRVRLTVPRWASLRDADAFLGQHRDWLEAQLRRQEAQAQATAPLRVGEPTALPLRGLAVPLRWCEGRFARAVLEADGSIRLAAPAQATPQQVGAALRALLEAEARRDIGLLLPRYLQGLPRAPLSLRVRPLASLWGSLSARDCLSLDLALVLGPSVALEYVLVHELCHLLHGDHSPRFWRAVEQRFPDWRAQRDYLRCDGLALKSELRRLLGHAPRATPVGGPA